MSDFWLSDLKPSLSQGDLVAPVCVGTATSPFSPLIQQPTQKGGIRPWVVGEWAADESGLGFYLSRGQLIHSVIVSYDCDLDKSSPNDPVSIAPVLSLLGTVSSETARASIRNGERYPFLFLPEIDGIIPDSYIDFRRVTYSRFRDINTLKRLKSASENGVTKFQAHLIGFYTRLDPGAMTA